jgi:type II restriction/modification system DNA methylase subunit YeeA
MFIERGMDLSLPIGYNAMVTMQSWMFLSSYEVLRKNLLQYRAIVSMVHMGNMVMGIAFGTAATVWYNKSKASAEGAFCYVANDDLGEGGYPKQFPPQTVLYACESDDSRNFLFHASAKDFSGIPGSPVAYWLTKTFRCIFEYPKLSEISTLKQGLATGDNDRFLRYWFEIHKNKLRTAFASIAGSRVAEEVWVPYSKGGSFRRWYGNNDYVVDWRNGGDEIRNFKDQDGNERSRFRGAQYYFRQAITWSLTSSSSFSCRLRPAGSVFDINGMSLFVDSEDQEKFVLGLLNSLVAAEILRVLNPTFAFQVGDIGAIPVPGRESANASQVETAVASLISIASADWDNFETSWDFRDQPLLRPGLKDVTLEASWRNWEAQSTAAIRRMQVLETENNRLFIAAYGLEGEIQPEVPEDQITLARPDQRKDVAAFLSYATGCMMGRYSLEHPGLILANAGDTLENYYAKVGICSDAVTFQPDRDGIIPVLDGEWFEDDIVARSREFLRVCFPASSLNTDLAFIETALGKDLRKYFCTDFYKDHLQTYKKRPIYWLVQSPSGPAKGGFACLIYLHRYTKDTLNLVLNNYFRPYLQKLEARLAQLGLDQLNDSLPSRDRTAARKEAEKITKVLKDCQAWEQDSLLPLAQQRIELDLDDGVKVNYLKLQDVLAPIPGLAAKEE